MLTVDLARLAAGAVLAHRLRSFLTALGIAVGIAAVVLLTAIGEGVHRFVLAEFTQFGTNLIAITPGKTETFGMSGAVISNVRPMSLDDAVALERLEQVVATVPVVQGNAQVESRDRRRRATIFGVGARVPEVWRMDVSLGRFLPRHEERSPRAYAVLGAKLHRELFGARNPLGQRLRVGGDRYRVIGVMETKGQFLGVDLDDAVYIPAAKALELFDRESLMEIDLLYRQETRVEDAVAAVRRLLVDRHGHEDFTIITQQQMLDVLGRVLNILTFAVGALGGISLFVGGVGILTIMVIAVAERTAEIGLMRAIGAARGQVLALFLGEAVLLAAVGGAAGLGLGIGLALLLDLVVPALPAAISWKFSLLAEALAVVIGLAAGVLPARRAAGLLPLDALRAE
ncbi:MAG: FtsX-like permease family protein [Gammaproteobacteria bacterium]|nr:FtsX-like permease family protein [Gammaproteobacteria bacterium]NIR85289.1 FtsX-like permease family protein [Gammaproteobacteria bacterium]NIR88405.1 FtsX-like permease family protein [Gammaproteobacteria bacterium]NIU06355.1 FtsX-like permease family protein [Gammaproteobacteria bacterium]NIV53254.1 FtsX-like permease family protein [Gammaproteobacteria bacterium]